MSYSYFRIKYYDSDLSGSLRLNPQSEVLCGARLTSPQDLFILSVDPMADKYPDISPYTYCVLNPLTLIDPDGNWPWEPKHIRQARKFARQKNGCISIERRRNGVKIANVGYRSSSSEFGDVFTLRSFAPENYNSKGSINKTSGIALAELWMDEPGETFWDDLKKSIGATLYSFINEPCEVLTGHTLAGNYINYDEKALSTIDVLSIGLGKFVQKGAQIIKTSGLTGLDKYNDFVKKSGGRHGRTQKEMGVMYQNNKRALEDYSNGIMTYNITTLGLSIINNSNNE